VFYGNFNGPFKRVRPARTYLFTTILIDQRKNLEDGLRSILDASIFFLFAFNSRLVLCSGGSTSWWSGSHRLEEGGIVALVFVRVLERVSGKDLSPM